MEHAIRSHIRKHMDEDPVLYRKLSERLNDILEALGEQWNEVISCNWKGLSTSCAPAKPVGRRCAERPARALRAISAHRPGRALCLGQPPSAAELLRLKDVTVQLVELLVHELQGNRDIWGPPQACGTGRPEHPAL